METTIMGYIGLYRGLYRVYIGIMEKKMENTIGLIPPYILLLRSEMANPAYSK